jgi:CRISPR-associated protein Csd1
MRLARAHLTSLRKTTPGAYVRLQEALEDVADHLQQLQFPPPLKVVDQGKFALGYYHQRAAISTARRDGAAAKREREAAEAIANEEEV